MFGFPSYLENKYRIELLSSVGLYSELLLYFTSKPFHFRSACVTIITAIFFTVCIVFENPSICSNFAVTLN